MEDFWFLHMENTEQRADRLDHQDGTIVLVMWIKWVESTKFLEDVSIATSEKQEWR